MDNKPNHSGSFWLSLDQMLKYIKGNLLGEKKTEVDDQLMSSDLMKDAMEGLGHVQNTRKLPETIDQINRQIALKSGLQNGPKPVQNRTSSGSFLTGKTLAIAASILLVATSAALFWWIASTPSPSIEQKAIAYIEPEEPTKMADKATPSPDTSVSGTDSSAIAIADTAIQYIAVLEDNTQDDLEPNLQSERINAAIKKDENAYYKASERKKKALTSQNTPERESEEEPMMESSNPTEGELSFSTEKNYSNSRSSENIVSPPPVVSSDESAKATTADSYQYTKEKKDRGDIKSDAQTYQIATSNYSNGELTKAEQGFLEIERNKKSEFYDDSVWHLGLIYLKNQNEKAAKKMFKKLRDSPKYKVKAVQELDKL